MSEPGRRRRSGGEQRIPRPPAWRLGDPPPWRMTEPLDADSIVQSVRDAHLDGTPTPPTFADARPSAVLVVLVDGPLGAEVLLTKRSPNLRKEQLRVEAVACLRTVAEAWARGHTKEPTPEAVWEQLWSLLEDHGVLRH